MIIILLLLFICSIISIDTTSQFSCSPNFVRDNVAIICTFLPQTSNVPVIGANYPSSNIKISGNGTLNGEVLSSMFGLITLLDDLNTYNFKFTPTYSDNFTISLTTSSNYTFKQTIVVYSIPDQSSLLACNSSVYIGSIPQLNGNPIYAYSNIFEISSGMILPRVRPLISIGNFTQWSQEFGLSFYSLLTTSHIGTWAITDGISAGTTIEVYSQKYITLMPYANNQKLYWVVSRPSNYLNGFIDFWFSAFETEPSTTCRSDFLAVYSGNITSISGKSPLYTFCGGSTDIQTSFWTFHTPSPNAEYYTLNTHFLINTTDLTFYFQSDASTFFPGFKLAYDFTYNITEPPDIVPTQRPFRNSTSYFNSTSNTFKFRDYSTGDYSTFLIDTSSFAGSIINFQFIWFDIYDTIYCDSDYIRIYDGKDTSGSLLAHVCGGAASFQTSTKFHSDFGQINTLNSIFTSTGQYLFVEVVTVSKTVTTGFNALPTLVITGVLPTQTQAKGDAIDSGFLVVPLGLFTNSRQLTQSSLTFNVCLNSGAQLPSFLTFDETLLQLTGTIPDEYPVGPLNLNVTAINFFGYSASLPWVLNVIEIQAPDNTSTFTCPISTITLSSTAVTPVQCIFSARYRGLDLVTRMTYLNPTILELSPGNPSAGAIGTMSLLNPQGKLARQFIIPYVPEASGGVGLFTCGIVGIPSLNITVYAATDNSSRITCSPDVVIAFSTVTCVVEARYLQAPVYSKIPFKIQGASVFSPYLDPTASSSVIFSDFSPSAGYSFTFSFIAPDSSCYYPVCIAAGNCYSPLVVTNADDSSAIECSQSLVSPGQRLLCWAYPRVNGTKVCSYSSIFNIYGSSEVIFINSAGPQINFYYTPSLALVQQVANNQPSLSSSNNRVLSSHSIKLNSVVDVLKLAVDGTLYGAQQILTLVPGPDETSSLSCPQSAPRGAMVVCIITARINNVLYPVLGSTFTPAIISGVAILGSIIQWRVQIQNPDNLVVYFQFNVQLTSSTDQVVITDGISGIPATIIGTSEPDSAQLTDCSTAITMLTNQTLTCSFVPLQSNIIIRTFSSRFSLSVVSTDFNINYGSVSSITAYDNYGNVTTNAAAIFKFAFTSPSISVQSYILFSTFYPNGDLLSTQTFTVTIIETPDSTSSLSCVSLNVTSYSPVVCSIIPRKKNQLIFASSGNFNPIVLTGVGSVSAISPASGNLLYFRVIIPQSYIKALVSDGLSSNFVELTTTPPSLLYSWAPASAFPLSLILPSLGRPVGDELLASGLLSYGSRVTGKEKLVSISCGTVVDYCIGATAVGSTVAWGVQSSVALGRDDLAGNSMTFLDTIIYSLQNIFVVQVAVINTAVIGTAWSFALTDVGSLYSWGDPLSSPSYFNPSSDVSFQPVLITNSLNLTLLSNFGSFLLGASFDGTVYSWGTQAAIFQLGRSGIRDVPNPVSLRIDGNNVDWSSLRPITQLLTGSNYGIIVSNYKRIFSWGLGLYNTILQSSTLPLEHDYSNYPMNLLAEKISVISGNDYCLVILTQSGNLYYLTLDYLLSGSISSKNNWELVSSSTYVFPINFVRLSVGRSVVLVTDIDGNKFSWTVASNSPSPYLLTNSPTQVNCDLIYSQNSQFCLASPINVRIHPMYASSECCGATCFNCSTLSNAIGNFTMIGTIFSLFSHSAPHAISTTIPIKFNDIKIIGLDIVNKIVVDCMGVQCFNLTSNGVIFESLSFQNGTSTSKISGGFIGIPAFIRLYMRDVLITLMNAYLYGGAIYNNGLLYASDTTFFKNTAYNGGGAIFTGYSGISGSLTCSLILDRVIFDSNDGGLQGGAIDVENSVINGTYLVIKNNVVLVYGGGINSDRLKIDCEHCFFDNNHATNGGALFASDSTIYLRSSVISNNIAVNAGGGIYVSFSNLNFYNSTISGNQCPAVGAGTGGGIYCIGQNALLIDSSRVTNNSVSTSGGGIAAIFCTPQIMNSTIDRNVGYNGGGVSVGLQASLIVKSSKFDANSAVYGGGGVAFQNSLSSFVSFTNFSKNTAIVQGGAIYVVGQTNATVTTTTFYANEAPAGGGVYWDKQLPDVHSASNLFFNNVAMQGPDCASEPKNLIFTQDWPQSYESNSGSLFDYPVSVRLLDFYKQIVSVDSKTSLSAGSSQLGVSLVGQIAGQLFRGELTFNAIGLTYIPTKRATMYINGFFSGIASFSTPLLSVPLRDCQPGEFFDGDNRCIVCSAGLYSSNFGSTVCSLCVAGSFSAVSNSSRCSLCAPGFYAEATGMTTCLACELGTYASASGSDRCINCPPGSASTARGSSFCPWCEDGWEAPSARQTTCSMCKVGYFSNNLNLRGQSNNISSDIYNVNCLPCNPGYYQVNLGSSFCQVCMAGNAATSSATCVQCSDNNYQPSNATTSCLNCWDYSSAAPDRLSCQCNSLMYGVLGTDTQALGILGVNSVGNYSANPMCVLCPTGANCSLSNTNIKSVTALPGYWPEIHGTNAVFYKCLSSTCVGGTAVCAENYYGPLCTLCAPGHGRKGQFECEACPSPDMNRFNAALGVLILLAMNVFLIYSTINSDKAETHSILIKIMTSCLQFNSLAANFQFQFPGFVSSLMSVQQSGGRVTDSFINFDCLFGLESDPRPVYIRTLLYLFLVPLIFILPALVFFPLYFREVRYKVTLEEKNECKEAYSNKYITSVVVGLFLQHPAIAQQALFMFACTTVGYKPEDSVMLLDMRESCYGSNYFIWRNFVAIPMTIFYVFGIPIVAQRLMKEHAHELDAPHIRARYQFLYGGYMKDRYYWEIVIIVRKLLMIAIIVFLANSVNIQALAAVLLIVIFSILHLIYQPFEVALMDNMEMLSLGTSFVTFFCGLFLYVTDGLSTDDRTVLSLAIVFSNVFFFALCLFKLITIIRDQRAMTEKLSAAGEYDISALDNDALRDIPADLRPKDVELNLANKKGDLALQLREMQMNLNIRQLATHQMKKNIAPTFQEPESVEKVVDNENYDDDDDAGDWPPGSWKLVMRLRDLSEESIREDIDEFQSALFNDFENVLSVDSRRLNISRIESIDEEEIEIEIIVVPSSGLESDSLGYLVSCYDLAKQFQVLCRENDEALFSPDLALLSLINPSIIQCAAVANKYDNSLKTARSSSYPTPNQ